jgi:hypothetical protein
MERAVIARTGAFAEPAQATVAASGIDAGQRPIAIGMVLEEPDARLLRRPRPWISGEPRTPDHCEGFA